MYTAKTDEITREYFNSLMVTPRYLDSDIPSLETEFFGKKFKTPVMTAALSHLHNICDNGMCEFAKGAKKAGALHFVGMCEDEELGEIIKTGADTVKIVKPLKDENEVFKKIEYAVNHKAFAVGMDIDHAISSKGEYDNVFGLQMAPKSAKQLEKYVGAAGKLPFIVKGVLSVSDAVKSVEAGASAIVVSHHHGIMDSMVPPLMVLPEIVREVKGKVTIFADCGFESGMDVFKALALGADGVCIGRNLMDPLKNGAKGVADRIDEINRELMTVMARTGFKTVSKIDSSVIRYRHF